jgi:hypothetical protein
MKGFIMNKSLFSQMLATAAVVGLIQGATLQKASADDHGGTAKCEGKDCKGSGCGKKNGCNKKDGCGKKHKKGKSEAKEAAPADAPAGDAAAPAEAH